MLVLKMKSMSLTTCLFGVSFFFHNVGNLNKQKLVKEVQGIHVVPCVTPVLVIHAYSLYCIRVIFFPWNTKTRDSDGNDGENLIGFEAR